MIALVGERGQAGITSHDVLNVPDDVVDELGIEGVPAKRGNFTFQEIHLIGNILRMDGAYSIQTVQSAAVDQPLQLGLDRRYLIEQQVLVSRGHPAFQFIGYGVVESADFRKRHLLLMPRHVASPSRYLHWSVDLNRRTTASVNTNKL